MSSEVGLNTAMYFGSCDMCVLVSWLGKNFKFYGGILMVNKIE